MKRVVVIVMMLLVTISLYAVDGNKKDNFAIGFNLSESNGNFGVGFEISSPYFAWNFLAIRGQVNMDFYRTRFLLNTMRSIGINLPHFD